MLRMFTCYVVLATLIWGTHTDDEKKVPDMFKSNMTRNDFSNLLSSLITLNEKRVNVLQKLYRLEDYGVLREVLRSGDEETGNANPSNLFLIVMSKNPTDSSRRKNSFQVKSLEVTGSNQIPKLDYVLDPSGFLNQNVRKDNALPESIFTNEPMDYKPKASFLFDDIITKTTTTTRLPQHRKPKKRKRDNKILKTRKETHKAKAYRKGNGRHEIISKNESPNTRKILVYSSTLAYKEHITQYNETEETSKKNELKDKPKTVKEKLSSNRNKNVSKVEQGEDYYGSLFSDEDIENYSSRSTSKIIGDFPTKKLIGNHTKLEVNNLVSNISIKKIDYPESNKNVSKENDSSINNHTKLEVNNLVSNISIKKIDYPESNKNVSKENDSSINVINYNNPLKPETNKSFETITKPAAPNNDLKINVTVDKASESNHTVFNISSINNVSLTINKDVADADYGFMINDKRKNDTEVLAPFKLPVTTKGIIKGTINKKYHDVLKNLNNIRENSNKDKMETFKDVLNVDKQKHIKPKKVKDYDDEEIIIDGKENNEVFTIIVTDEGKGKAEIINQPKGLELTINQFDQPEGKPVARKAFKKCLNKKAGKLCTKSCRSAYRNVCTRLKCTSRSKRALKKECKKSCNKTFKSSKYSDETDDDDDDESHSDESCDDSNSS